VREAGELSAKVYLPLIGKNFPTSVPPERLAFLRWRKQGEVIVGKGDTYDSAGAYSPDVIALSNGTYRMYYAGFDGTHSRILSAVSTDGENWSREAGVRIDIWGPYTALYAPEVIQLADGSYRMYFSARSGSPLYANIHSAASTDGIHWGIISGVRIQHGGTADAVLAQSPAIVQNPNGTPYVYPDGRFRMYYAGYDGTHFRILGASSTDGLTWQKEGIKLDIGGRYSAVHATDPEIVHLADGSFRMFYAGSNVQSTQTSATTPEAAGQFWPAGSAVQKSVILSAISENGQDWTRELGMRLRRGDAGRPDSEYLLSPTIVQIGGTPTLWYTASDGVTPLIMEALGLPSDARPLSDLQAHRISMAQAEVTVHYDLSDLLDFLPTNGEFLITASVFREGTEITQFTVPMQAISPTTGTAVIPLDYLGDTAISTDEIEVTLWAQRREFCPDPYTCHPAVGFDAYSEQFDTAATWFPGQGGKLQFIDAHESLVGQKPVTDGPYLNTRIFYNYYSVWGTPATINLEFYDGNNQRVDAFAIDPVWVYPDQQATAGEPAKGIVRLSAQYTGTASLTTQSVKAILRIGYHSTVITETTTAYAKTWNPLASGVIHSVQVAQPLPHQTNFVVDYDFNPRPGFRQPAWMKAIVLRSGSEVQDRFEIAAVPVVAGHGQVTVTANYTGTTTGYTTDQVRLEMSIPGLVLDDNTLNQNITWNPRETGKVSLPQGSDDIREPVRNGSELEVDLHYTYRSLTSGQATLRLEALGATSVSWPYAQVTVSPAEDAQQTLTLHYTAADENVTSTGLKATLTSKTTGEVLDERIFRLQKVWYPPTTGTVNSITITPLKDWKAQITVNYDYDSPLGEPAWLSTTWLTTSVGSGDIWSGFIVWPFDQTQAPLQEGTNQEVSFKAIYIGQQLNVETKEVRVGISAGRFKKRTIAYNWLTQTRSWSPPPAGSMVVTSIDAVDDRHINVHVTYSLVAGTCTNPTMQVTVWKTARRGPLPDFQGDATIECTGAGTTRTVAVPVAYDGDIPYLTTGLLRIKMLVNGVPVQLEGGKDFRLEYEYTKEWYTSPPGEIAEPEVTWISPRELALHVDYGYTSTVTATLRPTVTVWQEGVDVSDRFEVDLSPNLLLVPPEGKTGSLWMRIWYKDTYLDELVTDEIEVQLNTLSGQTRLAARLPQVLVWQHFASEEQRVAYNIASPDITRPDGVTIEARMNVNNPRAAGTSLTLKPLLWRANQPIIPVPEDDPGYSDHSEFLFDYSSDVVWGSGLAANSAAGFSEGPVQATYTKPVGKMQFDAMGFVLYEGDTPLYSRTFPFSDSSEGAIAAPDSILSLEYMPGVPDPDTGEVGTESSFIWNSGELWVLVSYAVNSDTTGMEVWPEEFSPGTDSPFYPFELVSEQSMPASRGLGLAIFRFRILDSYVDFILQNDDAIHWPTFGPASGLVCFDLGVPGQTPVSTKCQSNYTPPYGQVAAANFEPPQDDETPFPDQLKMFNIDYIVPPSSGIETPFLVSAVFLKDGQPLSGLSVFPVVITDTMLTDDGRGTISPNLPLVATYNSSDTDQDTVTSDEVMLILFGAEGEEGAPFYRETFPYQHTWTRTPDQVKVLSCESVPRTDSEPPHLKLTVEYTYTQATADRLADYGGVARVWAEGLKLTAPVGAYSEKAPIYTPSQGHHINLTVELHGDAALATTTHVAVYLESFIQSDDGLIRREGLAQTTIECASLLVNENAFIVASLEDIDVRDDGDTVTPVGEVMLATLGATSAETKESNRWPIERANMRWHEVHDTDRRERLLHPRFPLFTRRLYQMGPVLGVYVGAIEDDSLPSWVGTLLTVVTKASAIIADCFGQAEIASALEAAGQFAQQLLAKGSMPDLIDVWGVHLPASALWGTNAGPITYEQGAFYKKKGKIHPTIRTELITLPDEPKPLSVTLRKVFVHENGDNFKGEVMIHTRVLDGLNPSVEYDIGPRSLGDGSTWTLDQEIYRTDRAGPYLYVEVDVWDKDSPSVGDDNEMLGVGTWRFDLPEYGSDIDDPNCDGDLAVRPLSPSGDVTICIDVNSP
jgi:hypothetical protein